MVMVRMASRRENAYQASLIKKLEKLFPGCVILKNDPNYRQGMLDIIILWERFWASLEVKASKTAETQPNQEYYVQRLDEMSFAAIVYPENEVEVLNALQQAFKPSRRARVSKS
jgi:3-hydroxymyristoyl/3-hydroxydecanoyl-(acyl carrier protein) dehydratase